PVIAGDGHVAAEYRTHFREVPYTLAEDASQLEEALAALATDAAFRERETERVAAYVLRHHDEAAVALRYLDLLDDAIHWRTGYEGEPVAIPAPEVTTPRP